MLVQEEVTLLKILRIIFSIVTLALAAYGLITKNFEFQAYMILFLGLTMFVISIQEFQKRQKLTGGLLLIVFLFLLFVAIKSFI
ncbi:DUF3953 domain-containing protein [Lysinibacillus sp. LZ02]|uniref:DUF3953 domain-containing protein n=1 Tax=Lysinibacillus sp. LZ02 TaxID=3420668 RepID=UPI003D3608A5